MKMKILYFSWIKDKVGTSEEIIELEKDINTVEKLISFLKNKEDKYQMIFEGNKDIRYSVNMKNAKLQDSINNEDEIAFFPPMTGG